MCLTHTSHTRSRCTVQYSAGRYQTVNQSLIVPTIGNSTIATTPRSTHFSQFLSQDVAKLLTHAAASPRRTLINTPSGRARLEVDQRRRLLGARGCGAPKLSFIPRRKKTSRDFIAITKKCQIQQHSRTLRWEISHVQKESSCAQFPLPSHSGLPYVPLLLHQIFHPKSSCP